MFIETPSFPACPSFGYTVSPKLSVTVSQAASGREKRNRNWQRFLLAFNCQVGPRGEEEVEALTEFWYAVGATECGFRFKDYADYKSCGVRETPTAFDQPTESIGGSPESVQLIKVYNAGTRQQVRPILKPVQGTILLADGSGAKTEGTDYTLDYTTGIAEIGFTTVGTLTWGGEFDVPVRFDSEFPIELTDYKIQSVQFALAELRDPQGD